MENRYSEGEKQPPAVRTSKQGRVFHGRFFETLRRHLLIFFPFQWDSNLVLDNPLLESGFVVRVQ